MQLLLDPSQYRFSAFALLALLSAVLVLAAAVVLLLRERGSRPSELFLVQHVGVSLWLLAMAMAWSSLSADQAERWVRLVLVGACVAPAAWYQFIVTVLGLRHRRTPVVLGLWLLFGGFAVWAMIGGGLVAGMQSTAWGWYPRFDAAGGGFVAACVGGWLLGMRELLGEFWQAESGSARQRRLRQYLLAAAIGTLALVDLLPVLGLPVPPLGCLAVLVYLAIMLRTTWQLGFSDISEALVGRQIIDTMDDAVLVLDEAGRVQLANRAARQLLGLPGARLLGQSAAELMVHELMPDNLTRGGGPGGTRLEFDWRRPDGQSVSFGLTASQLADPDGRVLAHVCVLRDVTERKRSEQQALHDATHDALTGLPNRSMFIEHLGYALQQARRNPEYRFAVLYIDLDRFKQVNDRWGHVAADQLLVDFTLRLQERLRGADLVARLAGDEFAVLATHLADLDGLSGVGERLMALMQQPFVIDGEPRHVSASVGIALGNNQYAKATDLLRDADTAMYHVKQHGRAGFRVFSRGMGEKTVYRLQLETELYEALRREELELHYQPIMALDKRHIVGCEAMIRWRHPERGMIAPDDFIPLAEESGLILQLAAWLHGQLAADLTEWTGRGNTANEIYVGINVSDREFMDPAFTQRIEALLAALSDCRQQLRVELTERILGEHHDVGREILGVLRQDGVPVLIDDFGTGYSTLSRLRELPVDVLKIDRSFIAAMLSSDRDTEVVRTIINLAHQLNMSVVAEGVEEQHQLELLAEMGCDCVQGFLVAPPLPSAEFHGLLARHNPLKLVV